MGEIEGNLIGFSSLLGLLKKGENMKNIVDEVRYSKSAQNFIKSRNAKEKQRIKDIIENNLKHLPATGDIKPLEGKCLRLFSIMSLIRCFSFAFLDLIKF